MDLQKITLSVLMSVYKETYEWINEAIISILEQSFKEFEFIIINDNPEDTNLRKFLENWKNADKRIRLFTNELNIGLTKSLNRGLEFCQGKYIARMDADDIATKERFKEQLEYLEAHPNVGVCGSGIKLFGNVKGVKMFPESNEEVYLFIENCFAHPSVMVRSNLLKTYKYNESCRVAQDYELWYRMFKDNVLFHNIQKVLVLHRMSNCQVGKLYKSGQNALGAIIRRKSLDLYFIKNDIEFQIADKPITKDIINIVANNVQIPKKKKQYLLYLLALSKKDGVQDVATILSLLLRQWIPVRYILSICKCYANKKYCCLF